MNDFPGKQRGKKAPARKGLKSEVTDKRGEKEPDDEVIEQYITSDDVIKGPTRDRPLARSIPRYNWENKHILIAEDEELNYLYLKQVLMLTKVKLTWAHNGLEAVEFCREHPGKADLVLMDLRMPEMDGYDASSNIRKIDKKVPIVAQTAYTFTDDKKRHLRANFSAVLSKPTPPKLLLETISKHLPE